uniref:Cytochrome P450 n=1 Tax=Tetranychus urticae TaxID=32264 RepID=T1KYC9_TETUR
MFFTVSNVNIFLVKFFYGLVTLFLVNHVIKFVQRVRKLPPGPWGLPFVGYLPFLRHDSQNQMTELAAKYGPVFSFKCGKFDLIVINQWKFIKEALTNEHLLGRPKETILPGVIDHHSFAEMTGEPWKQQRRIALTTLRDVGFGKSEMEDSIRDEIKSFSEVLKSFKETFSLFKKFESHIIDEVDEHRKKDIDDNSIKDYIDGFLNEMSKRQNEKDSSFNLDTLQRNAALFYGAGSDTISNTLKWMMLYLVKYPEYQIKIRDEIKQTIGLNRQPENVDRQQMPFTMAFIYESLRFSSIVPLNLLRRATEDTKVGGYSIPKDSLVVFNFWSVHHDPNLWDNPELFKPERFLNEDKSKAIKPPYLVAFSGGRRVCPGESFAYLQLFLYLVSFLQQFEISAESGKDISLERAYYFLVRQKSLPNLIFKSVD